MWPPTITECECSEPGYCLRHQCIKGYWQHRLCRRQPSVFAAYEHGIGPGQVQGQSNGEIPQTVDTPQQGPGLLQRGMNFAKAGLRHIAGGMSSVDDAEYEARLNVCRGCDYCDQTHLVCLRHECGCFLKIKARWATETCPIGRWQTVMDPTDNRAEA